MIVSVIFIKTLDGTNCLIDKNDKWLDVIKKSISSYLLNRYIPDKDSVLSFCENAPCLKKLLVLVNTFINPFCAFSWIISTAELPDFNKVEILEFLLEPVQDDVERLNVPTELVEPVETVEPVSNRKIQELDLQIALKKIQDLEAELNRLAN